MIDLPKGVLHHKKHKHYLIVPLRTDIVKDLDHHQLSFKEWKELEIIIIRSRIFQLPRAITV